MSFLVFRVFRDGHKSSLTTYIAYRMWRTSAKRRLFQRLELQLLAAGACRSNDPPMVQSLRRRIGVLTGGY
jgi:hypothetical protein